MGKNQSELHHYAPRPARWDDSADDEDEADTDDGEWIDEEVGIEGVTGRDVIQVKRGQTDYHDPHV